MVIHTLENDNEEALNGPGVEGQFLGLPERYSAYETAQICILPVPFEASTSYQSGTARGPAALIEASVQLEGYDVETGKEAFRKGIHTFPPLQSLGAEEMIDQVQQVVRTVINDGKFPCVIGGEHSISQAPISAVAEAVGKISVLQLDAHTDLREAYEGSRFSHASVMARVKENTAVDNVVAVGIRAMAAEELKNADLENIFFDHYIQKNEDWQEQVLSRLTESVYISCDIDVLGCGLMPATGTPEPGGLDWFQLISILKLVCQKRKIVGFDLVELMPLEGLKAPDFLAAKLLYKFINYYLYPEME